MVTLREGYGQVKIYLDIMVTLSMGNYGKMCFPNLPREKILGITERNEGFEMGKLWKKTQKNMEESSINGGLNSGPRIFYKCSSTFWMTGGMTGGCYDAVKPCKVCAKQAKHIKLG